MATDDTLDAHDILDAVEPEELDDDATVALRPLFPKGQEDAFLAPQWNELFGGES